MIFNADVNRDVGILRAVLNDFSRDHKDVCGGCSILINNFGCVTCYFGNRNL